MMIPWFDPYFLAICGIVAAGLAIGLFGVLLARSARARLLWSASIPAGALTALLLGFGHAEESMPPPLGPSLEGLSLTSLEVALEDVTHIEALTDQKRSIKLQQAISRQKPEQYAALQSLYLDQLGLADAVTLLSDGWRNCNCHGWVFTGGRFFVESDSVYAILLDNAYYVVSSPRTSDVAVYRDQYGRIIHTGLVSFTGLGQIQVESKWGMAGLFLHPHDVHPYGLVTCTFYRVDRGGHILQGVRHDDDQEEE